MEKMLSLTHASYRYPLTNHYTLRDLNFDVLKGEFVALMGGNGAGKTTLCQLLSGIIPRSGGGKLQGTVEIAGLNSVEHPLAELSTHVGIVLDDPETQLFTANVYSEVAFGAENIEMDPKEIRNRVDWALDVVRMTGYEDREPAALSGGQKQRVAIATALVTKPEILILDEPTSQLDPIGTIEVFDVVRKLKESYGMTIVIATHKSEEVIEYADKVAVLVDGELVAYDKPQTVLEQEDLVKKAWLRLPQVSDLFMYLRRNGMDFEEIPFTIEQAVEMLDQKIQWNGGVTIG